MKENILQLEDASLEMLKTIHQTKEINIEKYLNVSIKRVKFDIINAVSKIFLESTKPLE